jgi:hypothetical protein
MDRARALQRACLALLLAASESQARSDCDPRSVALDITDGTAASASAASGAAQHQQLERIEQSVIAELGASQIAVCAAPEQAASLARVHIRATLPDWQRASIRFEAASAPTLERSLDVSKLPPEARALAIASATDELIRSGFAEPAPAPAAPPEPVPAADRPTEASAPLAVRDPREASEAAPLVEAGVAAAGSSYPRQRQAFEADLAARYWLLPRLPLSARFGVARRLSRPSEQGDVQPGADVHGALGAGYVLWNGPGSFEVIADSAVQLSRVRFDERMTLEVPVVVAGPGDASDDFLDVLDGMTRIYDSTEPLDHAWALAASLGVEGRVQTGPLGFSVALAALVPLVPPRSDWGNQTSLDTFGVQLRAGVWVLLGKAQSP